MRFGYRIVLATMTFTAMHQSFASEPMLCKGQERVVFSCQAGEKQVSLCGEGDLKSPGQHLIYRFGKNAQSVELEQPLDFSSSKQHVTFDHTSWAKGEISTISFDRGAYRYIVSHVHGAYGVDGGPNTAGVRVMRGSKEIATIACDASTAVDPIYSELHDVGLPSTSNDTHAVEPERQNPLPRAAPARDVAPLPINGKLLYVQQLDGGCVAGLWDSRERKTLMKSAVTKCPKAVSLTAHNRILVMIEDAGLQTVDLTSGELGTPVPLPEGVPMNLNTQALRAGYTPDGAMAFRSVVVNGDGSSDESLYLRKDAAWVVVERVHCPPFRDDCPFKQPFDAHALDDLSGTGPYEIWSNALVANPYVVKRIPRKVEFARADGSMVLNNTIVFRVDGRYTKLHFRALGGGGAVTMGLEVEAPNDLTFDITNVQFDATIRGRYLLFCPRGGGHTQLYDLSDGSVVLDRLTDAGWLD